VHVHGHVIGISYTRRWHDIDGRPREYVMYRASALLCARAERKAGHSPGSPECRAMHEADHLAWRERHGLPPLEEDDDGTS
jgi:hypothetical protein